MILRRIYGKKPCNFSLRWQQWLCSPTAQPYPVAGGGVQTPPPLVGWLLAPARINPNGLRQLHNSTAQLSFLNDRFSIKGCCYSTQPMIDLPIGGVVDIPLAQTGEGIAECELLKWFVQEGDEVEEFQPLCEVQSDKATIEITSRYRGKVSQILHVPGNIVKVGETLLKMIVDETASPVQTFEAIGGVEALDSYSTEPNDQSSELKESKIGGVLSTPAVRNLAKQHGIDIHDVHGTGKDGRVLKEDVLRYAASKGNFKGTSESGSLTLAEGPKSGDNVYPDVTAYRWEYEDKTVQLRGFQRAMVKSMALAAKVPHFHYVEEINCDALLGLKVSFQNENSDPNIKHTFLPILIKSLSMALSRYPMLNSCFNEELNEITLKGCHNIGIAMATPYGLVVPNIKKVQSLSILEITKELSRLHQLSLANKLSPEDVSGGTITLSNIGAIGGKFGSPLINVPEVSIIAIGRIEKVPRLDDDGNVYSESIMTVNIGSDHRVLDGATVAKFCNEWKSFIEKPETLLLHTR